MANNGHVFKVESGASRLLRRRVEEVTGSFRWENTGEREIADIIVEVDIDRLASELGSKALHSKGHKAVEAGGAVVVKVVNVRRGKV